MSDLFRSNRKVYDADVIRLNSVGMSLSGIAKQLGCNPTTITVRLASLGIKPADTRRTFMDEIYKSLTPDQQAWLEDQLGPHIAIRDFVKNLLVKEHLSRSGDKNAPVLQGN